MVGTVPGLSFRPLDYRPTFPEWVRSLEPFRRRPIAPAASLVIGTASETLHSSRKARDERNTSAIPPARGEQVSCRPMGTRARFGCLRSDLEVASHLFQNRRAADLASGRPGALRNFALR